MQRGQGQMPMQRKYLKHYWRGIRGPPLHKIDGAAEWATRGERVSESLHWLGFERSKGM